MLGHVLMLLQQCHLVITFAATDKDFTFHWNVKQFLVGTIMSLRKYCKYVVFLLFWPHVIVGLSTSSCMSCGLITLCLCSLFRLSSPLVLRTGYPGTVSLAAASLDAPSGPFGSTNQITRTPLAAAEGVAPIGGGGLSKGRRDAAIAVPVILGALIAACGSLAQLPFHSSRLSVTLTLCIQRAPFPRGYLVVGSWLLIMRNSMRCIG